MLYFILWVVFLLTIVLAVPIASFFEKRRNRSSEPELEAFDDDEFSGDDYSGDEPGTGRSGQDNQGQDNQGRKSARGKATPNDSFGDPMDAEPAEVRFDAPGGDDFSAFDDDFK